MVKVYLSCVTKIIQIVPNRNKPWTLEETVILIGRNFEKLSTRINMFTPSRGTTRFYAVIAILLAPLLRMLTVNSRNF